MAETVVIGIDPGLAKCGMAAVSDTGVLARRICPSESLVAGVREMLRQFPAQRIVIGGGTNGRRLARALSTQEGFPAVKIVEEEFTTLEAKKRYFRENPPAGLARLIPGSMRVPREPVDDWAAVILAERWLAESASAGSKPQE